MAIIDFTSISVVRSTDSDDLFKGRAIHDDAPRLRDFEEDLQSTEL